MKKIANSPIFGVAGNPPNFRTSAYRRERANAPIWLREIGLDALEVQCTYGVRMPPTRIEAFRETAQRCLIRLSVHAPYYITLGSASPDKIENSLVELKKSVHLAQALGATRVVFHIGSPSGDRNEALSRAIDGIRRLEADFDFGDVRLFPEIDGRKNWLGSLEEVIEVCQNVRFAWPCLDLAHLHARTGGALQTRIDFEQVLDTIEEALGREALEWLHFHMYPIEWNERGEVTHKAFGDIITNTQLSLLDEQLPVQYLPRYEPFLDVLYERRLSATVICEAKDSQDIGALEMKRYYEALTLQNKVRTIR